MSAFDPKRTSIVLPENRILPVQCRVSSIGGGATMNWRDKAVAFVLSIAMIFFGLLLLYI
jgi:hypothetical protein